MEPTTKKYKNRKKTKKQDGICSEVTVTVWGIHVVNPEKEKKRLRWEGFPEKGSFKPEMEE